MGTVHASNIVRDRQHSMKCARSWSFAEKEQKGERRMFCKQNTQLMTPVAINFGDGDGRVSSMKAHQQFAMLKKSG